MISLLAEDKIPFVACMIVEYSIVSALPVAKTIPAQSPVAGDAAADLKVICPVEEPRADNVPFTVRLIVPPVAAQTLVPG